MGLVASTLIVVCLISLLCLPEPSYAQAVPTPTPTVIPLSTPCPVDVDKSANPTNLVLGDTAQVQMTFRPRCQPVVQPLAIMLVIDNSDSFDDGPSGPMNKAKAAAYAILERLDPTQDRIGIATFASGTTNFQPLSAQFDLTRNIVVRMRANGNSLGADALGRAIEELRGPRRDVRQKPIIVVMSDGGFDDGSAMLTVAGQARQANIDVYGLYAAGIAVGNSSSNVAGVASAPDYYISLDMAGGTAAGTTIMNRSQVTRPRFIVGASVEDRLSSSVQFVTGSGTPPAQVSGSVLRWD
ncbi:MAG: VWA domain-containing protein, partial [Candidatus Promineofilum sp.]|nr:VWA domain-containing protein [Promineifilum sp.]